jgi:GT2 family glycosyltransferase
MIDLSIVIPTCNRAALLRRGLETLLVGVNCSYEIIIVDGASTDATPAVLDEAKQTFRDRLQIIHEPKRAGFTKATNLGFRAARGIFLTWLNDDARALAGSLDAGIDQLSKSPDTVGLLAMFHRNDAQRNVAYEIEHAFQTYRLMHVRGTLYANFALGLRQTFDRLGYFDERYYVCAPDPDLSLKVWDAGLTVEPAPNCLIDHEEVADARRAADAPRGKEDNAKLFAKWLLPEKNPHYNDFDPANPCTLRGLRPTPGSSQRPEAA